MMRRLISVILAVASIVCTTSSLAATSTDVTSKIIEYMVRDTTEEDIYKLSYSGNETDSSAALEYGVAVYGIESADQADDIVAEDYRLDKKFEGGN